MSINLSHFKTWLPIIIGVLVALPASAELVEDANGNITDTEDKLYYEYSGGHYTVKPAAGFNSTILNIPATMFSNTMGYPYAVTQVGDFNGTPVQRVLVGSNVTTILDNAFSGCTALLSLSFASEMDLSIVPVVTSVGENAFSGCSSLNYIQLPNSVTSIGAGAFQNCISLDYFNVPYQVESIGENTFNGCTALAGIDLGESVKTIGSNAFLGCTALASVSGDLSGIETIESNAFNGCKALTSMPFGNKLKYIGENAFRYCSALESVTLPDGVAGTIKPYAFAECSALQNVYIGNAYYHIGSFAFSFTGIKNITIPTSVITLEFGAFKGCKDLETAVINARVSVVGYATFSGCTSLNNVTLPDNLTVFDESCFDGCALTSLTLPASVTSLGNYAFRGNPLTDGIICLGTSPAEGPSNCFDSSVYNDVELTVPFGCKDVYASTQPWCNFASLSRKLELPQITENTTVDFANDLVDGDTGNPVDLSNTVINDVYYNLSNTYDAEEKCFTLDVTSSTDVDDIIGKDINDEMVAAQYNGMIIQVGGTGKIVVSFATEGTQQLNVRIGDGELNKLSSESKYDQAINYYTETPVYVYIYATDSTMDKKPGMMREGELLGSVKIYGLSIEPEKVITGVEDISISPADAPTEHIIFNINGVRCSEPLAPGFYIIDGSKVIIR